MGLHRMLSKDGTLHGCHVACWSGKTPPFFLLGESKVQKWK